MLIKLNFYLANQIKLAVLLNAVNCDPSYKLMSLKSCGCIHTCKILQFNFSRCNFNLNFLQFSSTFSQTNSHYREQCLCVYKEHGSFCLPQCLYRRQWSPYVTLRVYVIIGNSVSHNFLHAMTSSKLEDAVSNMYSQLPIILYLLVLVAETFCGH